MNAMTVKVKGTDDPVKREGVFCSLKKDCCSIIYLQETHLKKNYD